MCVGGRKEKGDAAMMWHCKELRLNTGSNIVSCKGFRLCQDRRKSRVTLLGLKLVLGLEGVCSLLFAANVFSVTQNQYLHNCISMKRKDEIAGGGAGAVM